MEQSNGHFKLTKDDGGLWTVWDKSLDPGAAWSKMFHFKVRNHDITEFHDTCLAFQRAEDPVVKFMCINPVVMLKVRVWDAITVFFIFISVKEV